MPALQGSEQPGQPGLGPETDAGGQVAFLVPCMGRKLGGSFAAALLSKDGQGLLQTTS